MTVKIVTSGDRSASMGIGAEGSPLAFAADPVEITTSVNDTGDHLLRSEASVRLLARDFVPDFFCSSCRDAVVNILKDGVCVFAGFIQPQVYSQPYNELWDELTLSCIDALSALQYSRYGNVGMAGIRWEDLRQSASMRSMKSIVASILGEISSGLDLSGGTTSKIWQDGSRMMPDGKTSALEGTTVSELLFLGDDEDGVWTQEEVLEEILRYLNLRCAPDGFDFRLFGWETLTGSADVTWREVSTGATQAGKRVRLTFANSNATDCDTQISVGETFNRISLTCSTESVETLVTSPLDENDMTSPYSSRQLYMREYVVEGTGKNGAVTKADGEVYADLISNKRVLHEGAYIRDWYLRVMDHPSWRFADTVNGGDLMTRYCTGNANQQGLPNALANQLGACLVSWGNVKTSYSGTDNTVPGQISMSNALVLSVNGNGDASNPGVGHPNRAELLAAAPVAVYEVAVSGGTFSPADDETTNYIVISGKIILNPLPKISVTVGGSTEYTAFENRSGNGEHMYSRSFFKAATPSAHAVADPGTRNGLQPFSEMDPGTVENTLFNLGGSADKVYKIPVVRCMLVIGDKCVVEGGSDGLPSDFVWRAFKERSQCADDAEYYAQSFTVGLNPAAADMIVGTEYPVMNNIAYNLGIDAEGTAIPIRRRDSLSGKVRFEIIGVVNTYFNGKTGQSGDWTGSATEFSQQATAALGLLYLIPPRLSNVILKDFEVNIYCNNGGDDPLDGSDLIYMSDTDEKFINEKDDITFRIVSALTTDERRELGVRDSLMLSTPCDASTGLGVTSLRFAGTDVKPEQAYVDALYRELRSPRVEMEQSIADTPANVSLLHRYIHPAMPAKIFIPLGISRNLREGSARLKLKEAWQ